MEKVADDARERLTEALMSDMEENLVLFCAVPLQTLRPSDAALQFKVRDEVPEHMVPKTRSACKVNGHLWL